MSDPLAAMVSNVQTGLRIRRIDVMRSQQAMSLRSYIAHLQHNVSGQFPLDIEVVLSRILGAHVRLKIPVQQHGAEAEAQSCGVPGVGLRIPVKGLGLRRAGL